MRTTAPGQTRGLGLALGEALQEPALILLSGELGAGKTCFVQGLARGLGVAEEEAVTSPTFTLMNQYRGRLELYHFDLYRIAHAEELTELGMDEFLPGRGVAVVEWAERLAAGDMATLSIRFEHAGEEGRRLTFQATGPAGERLLEELRCIWQKRGIGE